MPRRKSRTRRSSPDSVALISPGPPSADRPGWWGLVKAVLGCGAAGGLVGAAVGAALVTEGYARPAALIGGIPAGSVGVCALGWYGWQFVRVKRRRRGTLVGAALGLLGAGTLGVVAGLSVWALPWSLVGAIIGSVIQWSLTMPERRSMGLFPGIAIGSLVGILVRADRTGSVGVPTGASYGTMVGAVLGVLLIPALMAWLLQLPEMLRRRKRR
jgi:hypothetical protein